MAALLSRPEFVRVSERGGEPTIEMRREALVWLVAYCSAAVVPCEAREDVLAGRMGHAEVDGQRYLLLTSPADGTPEDDWVAAGMQ
jgi:hypothetical protein